MSRSVYARQQLSRRIGAAAAAELTTMDVVRTRSMLDMPRPHQRMEDHKAEYRAQQSPWKDLQAVQATSPPPDPVEPAPGPAMGLPACPARAYKPAHAGYPGELSMSAQSRTARHAEEAEFVRATERLSRLSLLEAMQCDVDVYSPYLCVLLDSYDRRGLFDPKEKEWVRGHIKTALQGHLTLSAVWRKDQVGVPISLGECVARRRMWLKGLEAVA